MVDFPVVLSITQLNTYIKSKFDGDENLAHVFVSGEISNFTNHYKSGHFYLSLKDEKCVIRAVMFAQNARRIRFLPQDGMKVIVRGRVSVYEATGQYQLYIDDMQPDGLGALNLAFEQLKAKLEAEGLFAPERKTPLPAFPERIGVITSPTGAAVHDITSILARRYPLAEIVFCPVLVQGEGAAPQIVDALARFNRLLCADVIILGRGGGSLEDLWPFNEEMVARAVAASEIPVISAVGHETDFTICDFVADLRAPTPSAAAELAVPDRAELEYTVRYDLSRLKQSMRKKLAGLKQNLDALTSHHSFKDPLNRIELERIRTDQLAVRLNQSMRRKTADARSALSSVSGRLNALSPLATLSRGYSIIYGQDGHVVTRVSDVKTGERISVLLNEGTLGCVVDSMEEKHE
ncbi:exodeoxyribonuclease VII large subunit [Caproiciproducens sp. CPB-2]|uniref:exodeoxyribonuclease VII large subunit n=1 Tax=Caproiciproducens sp. CPB-2 TaxID=3030017 RepID=UPI0023DAA3DF|nr:exodeoxyribonuclease VII large subunit [Caproiciproducens sp. CPB-2]MDF1496214.1 exodeoxyribonuclease VII large subunit [Caproiciproducens sp. CPB-2]